MNIKQDKDIVLDEEKALSYVIHKGDGITADFAIPFPYLKKEHIHVILTDKKDLSKPDVSLSYGTDFTFTSANTIELTIPPSAAEEITIKRITERQNPLVDFTNGSTLTEEDLDAEVRQLLFICQEAFDALSSDSAKHYAQLALEILKQTMQKYEEFLEAKLDFDEKVKLFLSMKATVVTNKNNTGSAKYDFNTGMLYISIPEAPKGEKGDKGDKGDQGVQGVRGLQGLQGIQGLKGDRGLKGDKGDRGERGFKGEKGDTGDQGHQGFPGEKGEKGDPGDITTNVVDAVFLHFFVDSEGFLSLSHTNDLSAVGSFAINNDTGELEAAYN